MAGIEALLVLAGIGELFVFVRRYQRGRSAGLDFWSALEDGLSVLLPYPVAKLATLEPRLFCCLLRWALRKTRLKDGEFGYHKRSQASWILLLIALVSPVEVIVGEILLPWAELRIALLVVEVYAVLWVLGFYASLVVLPHHLEETGIRLRYGPFAEAFVPYSEIEEIESKPRKSPRQGDGLKVVPDEASVYLAINGKTNLTLTLGSPQSVKGPFAHQSRCPRSTSPPMIGRNWFAKYSNG